jgi:hypothetical protein
MNYEDERIKRLEQEKANKLTENNSLYDDMINDNKKILEEQNNWQESYLDEQNRLIDRGKALTTDRINQNKKSVEESYQKEALASESSYQDFINPYGTEAEQKAETGMTNTGYSESTKATAYGAARIRTALARSAAIKANTEYDNQIKEAELSNDSQKANLAMQVLKEKLANQAAYFQTEIGLKQNKLSYQTDVDNTYYNRYQDVFNQQNYEKEQAENLRKYQEELAYRKEQEAYQKEQDRIKLEYQKQRDAVSDSQWEKSFKASQSSGGSGGGSPKTYDLVTAEGYQGKLNPNTKYGTFETLSVNGVKYQPNNVGTYKYKEGNKTITAVNTLSKTGVRVADVKPGLTGYGGNDVSKQNLWKDKTGKICYWDGSINDYRRIYK